MRRAGVELAPAADGEAEAVARHERARERVAGHASQLVTHRRIAQEPLRLVPARQAPREDAVADEVGASGRQPLARDALRADEPVRRAVVVEGERRRRDALAQPAEERRVRRVDARRRAGGHDDVVQEIGHRLAPEHDRVRAGRHAGAVDGRHRVLRRLDAGLVGEVVQARAGRPAGALGVVVLHHGGHRGRDHRGLVRLHGRQVRGHDRDPLLDHGDVATHDEAEARASPPRHPPDRGAAPRS